MTLHQILAGIELLVVVGRRGPGRGLPPFLQILGGQPVHFIAQQIVSHVDNIATMTITTADLFSTSTIQWFLDDGTGHGLSQGRRGGTRQSLFKGFPNHIVGFCHVVLGKMVGGFRIRRTKVGKLGIDKHAPVDDRHGFVRSGRLLLWFDDGSSLDHGIVVGDIVFRVGPFLSIVAQGTGCQTGSNASSSFGRYRIGGGCGTG